MSDEARHGGYRRIGRRALGGPQSNASPDRRIGNRAHIIAGMASADPITEFLNAVERAKAHQVDTRPSSSRQPMRRGGRRRGSCCFAESTRAGSCSSPTTTAAKGAS